jgi:hypothetical protein
MNEGYGNGAFDNQGYGYSQEYRPSGYQSRLDDFYRAYASQNHASHGRSYQSHSTSDYIAGPKYVESDHIAPHNGRSHRSRPKHNQYTSGHSNADYISPPPLEDRDDYISQDYDTTHQRTYHQVPGAWDSYEEPEETQRSSPQPPHRATYAAPYDETSNHRPMKHGWDTRHDFMPSDDSEAWTRDVYEDSSDVVDYHRRVNDAQTTRPRSHAQRDGSRLRRNSFDYESDLQTCVDSEAQQLFYVSGSDIGSLPDETSSNGHRSISPTCPGHFPPSPGGDYAHNRSPERSYAAQRYASSSPSRLDDSIVDDYSSFRQSPECPVARPYATSPPYAPSPPIGNSDHPRYRHLSGSPVAHLRAPSPPNGNSDYARYRQSSDSPVTRRHASSSPDGTSDYPRYRQSSGSPLAHRHASSSPGISSDYTRYRQSSGSPIARRYASLSPSRDSEYTRHRGSSGSPVAQRYLSETSSVHTSSDFEIDGAPSMAESEMERIRRSGSEVYVSSDAGSDVKVVNESDDDDGDGDAISDGWDEDEYGEGY